MRRWTFRRGVDTGALEELEPVGEPGPGEVVLRMTAWSLNFRDLLMVRGEYDPRLKLPYVPLSDGVGEVVAVGPGVTRVAVGDHACPTFSPGWIDGAPDADAVRRTRGGPIPGVLAERLRLPADEVVKVPSWLEPAEAATLPCAGLTAWSALTEHARLPPGASVLVLGSGGVSVFALQLARAMGLRVLATSGSATKAERLLALGAEQVWRHDQEPDWGRAIRKHTGGGVDAVVEVGGAGTLARSLDAVRVGGTVLVIGNAAGSKEPLSVLPILMRQVRCQGVFVGHRRGFEELCRAIEHSRLRPVVDRVFPFVEAPEAFAHLAAGGHVGKVCLTRV